MNETPKAARWGPIVMFGLVSGAFALALAVRAIEAPRPAMPLATAALEAYARWSRGELRLDPETAPEGLPHGTRWRSAASASGRLDFGVPGPGVDLPWRGAAVVRVGAEGRSEEPAFVQGFGGPAAGGRALVLAVPTPSEAVMGTLAGPLASEWAQYAFRSEGEPPASLVAWRRGAFVFVAVTDRDPEVAAGWIPAVTDANLRLGPDAGVARPGSTDPTR